MLAACEYVTPAIEILDARIQMKDPDTGTGAHDRRHDRRQRRRRRDRRRPTSASTRTSVDLPWVCAVLRRNGQIEESGVAAAVLDHPARGVAWLADRLAEQGITLRAGELILAGSFTRPLVGAARCDVRRRLRTVGHDRVPVRLMLCKRRRL